MTKARQAALDVLQQSSEPLSAAGVLAKIALVCDQATVYRSLDYLERQGLAESFTLHCKEHGTERYYVLVAEDSHNHWFHCENCHCFIDLGHCRLGDLGREMEQEKGLRIRRHVLYFTGYCANCATAHATLADGL